MMPNSTYKHLLFFACGVFCAWTVAKWAADNIPRSYYIRWEIPWESSVLAKDPREATLRQYLWEDKGCITDKPWIRTETIGNTNVVAGNAFTLENGTHVPLKYRLECTLLAETKTALDDTETIAWNHTVVVLDVGELKTVPLRVTHPYDPNVARLCHGRYRLHCRCSVSEYQGRQGDALTLELPKEPRL